MYPNVRMYSIKLFNMNFLTCAESCGKEVVRVVVYHTTC